MTHYKHKSKPNSIDNQHHRFEHVGGRQSKSKLQVPDHR